MSVGVILQARMGSTRLPSKVLKPIAGKALLDHVLGRLSRLACHAKVVVATSDKPLDDTIVQHCLKRNVALFRGSETDVLDRHFQCARENRFEHVVRLTADNPLTDIEELQRLIVQHTTQHKDYTHSFETMPLGVGAEIFTFSALERSMREGRTQIIVRRRGYICGHGDYRATYRHPPPIRRHTSTSITAGAGADCEDVHPGRYANPVGHVLGERCR